MTVYIPIMALEMLEKGDRQDITAVITTKPAKPEVWVKVEVAVPAAAGR